MNICEYGCGGIAYYILSNGRHCCQSSFQKCSAIKLKNSIATREVYKFTKKTYGQSECPFCCHLFSNVSFKSHLNSCYLNPSNLKLCPVCGNAIKDYKHNDTCSHKCGHVFSRDNYLKCWKKRSTYYVSICFNYHDKKCIICGESLIVAVHHFDGNPDNNDPSNLIPVCPTHHQYCHSRYYDLVKDKIESYRNLYIAGCEKSGISEGP